MTHHRFRRLTTDDLSTVFCRTRRAGSGPADSSKVFGPGLLFRVTVGRNLTDRRDRHEREAVVAAVPPELEAARFQPGAAQQKRNRTNRAPRCSLGHGWLAPLPSLGTVRRTSCVKHLPVIFSPAVLLLRAAPQPHPACMYGSRPGVLDLSSLIPQAASRPNPSPLQVSTVRSESALHPGRSQSWQNPSPICSS
jgi:hypothetical protein